MSAAQAAQPTRESWQTRRERVLALLQCSQVRAVIDSLAQTLPEDKPASQVSAPDQDSRALDLALCAWWPVCTSSRQDGNTHRAAASEALASLALANVKESDFTTESSLMRGGGGFCEVMRCRMDRQLYVVKSASKRTVIHASRVSNLSPALERHILSLATQATDKLGESPAPVVYAAWQGRNDVFIAMEYFPVGDLHMLLASAGEARANCAMSDAEGRIREDHVRSFGKDMVSAVSWLHAEGYMHRDIKPANWLVAKSGHLKLCDFGIAAPFSTHVRLPELLILRQERAEKEQYSFDESASMWDSPQKPAGIEYVEPAPDAEGDYGPDIDWWGVGLILYEMTYRLLPFIGTPSQVVEQKLNLAESFHIDTSVPRSEDLHDVLRALIAMPEDRLGRTSSEEIQSHPFFRCKDWSRPYAQPAPFRPTLPGQGPDGDPELSIVHSPRAAGRPQAGWDSLISPSVQSSFNAS